MGVIYEPKGKAREYSPLALNLYLACTHGCKYCYAPSCMQRKRESYFKKPEPRKNIIENLKKELAKGTPKEQVLLSFIGDVYCESEDGGRTTTEALEILQGAGVPVAILTKGGFRCLKDMELFKRFHEHIQVGATLTFDNDHDSLSWESGAAIPSERLAMLATLKEAGIRTFVSFEPVIDAEQSLSLIRRTLALDCVDVYKVGKVNNFQGIDKTIDWTDFLERCLDLIRPTGKELYIKHDLRQEAIEVDLSADEVDADVHNVN